LKRAQARLGSLSAEQAAAVEALTRGLVNKFLHPPMQALKQAARENDAVRLETLCETWSLPANGAREAEPVVAAEDSETKATNSEKAEGAEMSQSSGTDRK
jgi:glutamyl-tRNA reductase